MGDVCVGSGSELRPGCLLMLALFLQALSAAADLALFFFLLHFFSLLFVTSHRLHAAQTNLFLPARLPQSARNRRCRAQTIRIRDEAQNIVGWKEQLGPLASVRQSICPSVGSQTFFG